jgi:hypothetical protein
MRLRLYSTTLILLSVTQFAIAGETPRRFLESGTNRPFDVTKHSVPIEELRSGLPKDGIPAIAHPKFVSVNRARELVTTMPFGHRV